MTLGFPRRPNDPSIMASVEAAVSTIRRPGIIGRIWRWRYELALIAGLPLAVSGIAATLGLDWLTAVALAGLAVLTAALAWPTSRRHLIARARCVITPHRVRTSRTRAWIHTRDGRLPAVLYAAPEGSGERVWLWCRAVITAGDLEEVRDILRAACWATDVRVVMNDRRSHIVVLEVIRRRLPGDYPGPDPDQATPGWPHQDRGQGSGAGPLQPALPGGA